MINDILHKTMYIFIMCVLTVLILLIMDIGKFVRNPIEVNHRGFIIVIPHYDNKDNTNDQIQEQPNTHRGRDKNISIESGVGADKPTYMPSM